MSVNFSQVCVGCNKIFSLAELKVSWKGKSYHLHCFRKAEEKGLLPGYEEAKKSAN